MWSKARYGKGSYRATGVTVTRNRPKEGKGQSEDSERKDGYEGPSKNKLIIRSLRTESQRKNL